MLGRLILLFLLTPAIELGLLMKVAEIIDFWPTIGLILVTGIAGSYLAKREGLATWNRLNERLGEGGLPGKELLDGVIILVAGALLITPGVLTDVIGFMGLLPPTRALIRKLIMKRIKKKVERGDVQMQFGFFGGGFGGGGDFGGGDFGGGDFGDDLGGGDFGGGSPYGPSDGSGAGSGGSKSQGQGESGWEGTSRQVPGHADEVGEPSPGREERDAV